MFQDSYYKDYTRPDPTIPGVYVLTLVILVLLVVRSSYNAVLKAQSIALEIIGGTMSDWFLGIRNLGLLGMI